MNRSLNPALGYNRFAEIVRGVEPAVLAAAPMIAGYGADAVGRRLLQRIVELGLHPFLQAGGARNDRGLDPMPAPGQPIEAGGLLFASATAEVTVTLGLWLKSMAEFVVQWLRVLAIVLGALRTGSVSAPNRTALLFGIGSGDIWIEDSDRRFVDFCQRGPIEPLCKAPRLVVECSTVIPSTKPGYCTYAQYPLFALLRDFPVRATRLLHFSVEHLMTAVGFVVASIGRPLACVLARDLAFHSLVAHLNRMEAIDCVIVTNSHFHVQPLWMRALPGRRFTTHMVWYSQNSIPFAYRDDGVRSYLPNHRYIEVDGIWVWTEGFGAYLAERGARGSIRAVGPILWYRREPPLSTRAGPSIVVFDVTPQTPELIHQVGLTYNYYRSENVRAFIEDILATRDEVAAARRDPIPVFLKHKRAHSAHHDRSYLDFIDERTSAGAIRLVPAETNLYSLIDGATVVIVIPYSSPAYVAEQLGVPAIYYDPSEEIVPAFEASPLVRFAGGRAALRRALSELLNLR